MNDFDKNADFGNEMVRRIAIKKGYDIRLPKDRYSTPDVFFKKNDTIAIAEFKYRSMSDNQLINKYNNELLIEEDKLNRLLKEYKNKKLSKCLYICSITSGDTYFFDLTNPIIMNLPSIEMNCPHYTSVGNKQYKKKNCKMLSVSGVYMLSKTKINIE